MLQAEQRRRLAAGAAARRIRTTRVHSQTHQTFGLPSAIARRGKICYELTLESISESVRVGWATDKFLRVQGHSSETIGDDTESWALDGQLQIKCHDNAPEGEPWDTMVEWKAGDVIGVAADLTKKIILFAQNGEFRASLLKSFASPRVQYSVNFGFRPFRYPPPDETYIPVARAGGADAVMLRGAAGVTGGVQELMQYSSGC
eukprot:gene57583-biopygen77747